MSRDVATQRLLCHVRTQYISLIGIIVWNCYGPQTLKVEDHYSVDKQQNVIIIMFFFIISKPLFNQENPCPGQVMQQWNRDNQENNINISSTEFDI